LGQSEFALRRFRTLEGVTPTLPNEEIYDHINTMRFYGESFYYFTWRCVRVMRLLETRDLKTKETKRPFEALKPKGVRIVRNQLIEHPDKSNGFPVRMLSTTHPKGLVLHRHVGLRPDEPDSGLYLNAEEFIVDLTRLLRQALAR
jgi:hypothetical protein